MPAGAEVHAFGGYLFVYRPECVLPLISTAGGNIVEVILQTAKDGTNGRLLGYVASSILQRPAVAVRVVNNRGHLVIGFHTTPEAAEATILARLNDLIAATGETDFEVFVEDLP